MVTLDSDFVINHIQQKQEVLDGKNLSQIIGDLNDLIEKNIEVSSTVESIISTERGYRFPQLKITVSVVSEIILHLYEALRYLKKANKKRSFQLQI